MKWDFIHVFKTDISVVDNQENFRECTGVVFEKSQNSNSTKTSTLNIFNFTSQKIIKSKNFRGKFKSCLTAVDMEYFNFELMVV